MNNLTIKKTITVAEKLVNTLLELEVDSIFGYPGASVLSIYNELSNVEKKIKHYLVRHEQAAIHAAEGYARVSGKVGVVLVTSGPGFTNTITGIANAYSDSTPLVVLAGDINSDNKSEKVFQHVNIPNMVKTCSKKCFVLSPDTDIENILKEAFELADSGIKGPVIISLPRNLLESNYIKKTFVQDLKKQKKFCTQKDIQNFKEFLNNSKQPIVLIGGGIVDSSEKLFEFVNRIKCPVVSTLMGIGNFPTNNEFYYGMIGMNGNEVANFALKNSDLIISLGVSYSNRTTCNNNIDFINTKIIDININNNNKNFDLKINSNLKSFFDEILQIDLPNKYNKAFFERLNIIKKEHTIINNNQEKLNSAYVLNVISEFTKNLNPIVVTDVGQHQMITAQNFTFTKPRKFITSGGMGTMGFGLPASIGAYISKPNNLILNITGDGSFQMNLQELATCREHNIPIKIIILNNGYLGMVRQMQDKIYHNTYQVEMINPDFTKIAEAYDLCAIRVKTKEELIPALKNTIEYNGTVLLDIIIDSYESI